MTAIVFPLCMIVRVYTLQPRRSSSRAVSLQYFTVDSLQLTNYRDFRLTMKTVFYKLKII